MAGRTRFVAALIALIACGAACSNSNDDIDAAPPETESSTTTTVATTLAPTTTTIATTTTLSEQAIAEAEVEQLLLDWWLGPFDTSTDDKGMGLDHLTGLVERRIREYGQQLTEQGEILQHQGQERIEVVAVRVDLEDGKGEADICSGASGVFLDAETLEPTGAADDPEYLTTTLVYVELTPEGWKISELLPSVLTEPETCEITS
ncbi:MAG: hypothetical protein ACRBK7_24175 [Acidimicrobiales bacterium]